MSSPDFDRNQVNTNPGNPEQRPIDPRIVATRRQLTESARVLNDSLRLSTDEDAFPNSYIWEIAFRSEDRLKKVSFTDKMFTREDFTRPNLPEKLKHHDRIIPIRLELGNTSDVYNPKTRAFDPVADYYEDLQLWMSLDADVPTVYQLIKESGEPYQGYAPQEGYKGTYLDELTGRETVITRPDLLPSIVDAVSSGVCFIK